MAPNFPLYFQYLIAGNTSVSLQHDKDRMCVFLLFLYLQRVNLRMLFRGIKTSSVVWSGSMGDDEEGRISSANFRKENI
jgi:hypothetical protein